jgi:alanyl-tRNA synthetase
VEAVTGLNALAYVQQLEATLGGVAGTLRVTNAEVPARVVTLLGQIRDLERELTALKGKLASTQGDEMLTQAVDLGGVKLLVARLDGADVKTLRDTVDKLKDKLKTAVVVLGVVDGEKVQIVVGVTADTVGRVKAGELVNFIAAQVGGKGGGKADMAMAGGTEPAKLAGALASVQAWVGAKLV